MKGKTSRPLGFMIPLYAEPLEVNDGKALTHKEFVEVDGFSAVGIRPKRINIVVTYFQFDSNIRILYVFLGIFKNT